MAGFLSKVFGFGGKKSEAGPQETNPADSKSAKRAPSNPSLLDGKFEVVPDKLPPSASASGFTTEASTVRGSKANGKGKEEGSRFRAGRSRPSTVLSNVQDKVEPPLLSLNLPGSSKAEMFQNGSEGQSVLDDVAIGAKRLSPSDTLVLINACSQVIIERGESI